MSHNLREMRFVGPVELAIEASAEADKPALVRIDAYSGGIMTVSGFGPVVLDVEGIESPERVPLLADHENRIHAVLGSGTPSRKDGRLSVEGTLSRTNELALRVIDLHRDGVPLQASVGAEPLATERIPKGKHIVVNGRTIRAESASFLLVRRSRLKHVAIVPNGADGSTSVSIAAQAASSKESFTMEFSQWIEAQGFSADQLDAQQTTSLQAMFDASQKPKGTEAAAATARKDASSTAVADLRAELAAETSRVAGIRKLCAGKHADIEAKAIGDGWDVTRTELEVVRAERPKAPAMHASSGGAAPTNEMIEAALCLQANLSSVEQDFSEPTLEAASKLHKHGMGMQWLLIQAAQANGLHEPITRITKGNIKQVLEAAFSPIQASFSTFSVPGIFSNVANKFILQSFMGVEQTWRSISAIGTVSDFKPIKRYRLTGDMAYEPVAPTGELKHGKVGEQEFGNQANTYGKIFSITRTAIINDDLRALSDIPKMIGRGAAQAINDVFWREFLDNAAFFATGNKNYAAGTSSPDTRMNVDGLDTAFQLFLDQLDPDGNPLGIQPAILLVPNALFVAANQLMNSTEIREDGNSAKAKYPISNPFAGRFRVERSSHLASASFPGSSNKAWYLLAEPADMPVIEVVFLDGQETPTVETADADFDQLGIRMRGYHDFGVAKQEHRGGVKLKGEA